MSLQKDILKALKNGPAMYKQLKADTGAKNQKLEKALKTLVRQKKIEQGKKGYALCSATIQPVPVKGKADKAKIAGAIPAKIVKLGRTFGFAAPLDGGADIFIPGRELAGAMPGDEVLVSLFEHPRVEGSREGEVVSVQVQNNRIVGRLELHDGKLVIFPDAAPDTAIAIRKNADGGALPGEKAAAAITLRGTSHAEHRAQVLLRFGAADSAKECARAILYAAGIEQTFPEEAKAEAKKAAAGGIPASEIKKRKDLRDVTIFTIDGASTKDIDDAVSAKKVQGGYKVGVHIADVSHYVRPQTPLGEEAMHRGTSIYFADSVIPMLPKSLSNGICSLNPGEDRLAFSCIMDLDEEGRMTNYKFVKTVIRSRMQGVYEEINTLYNENAEAAVKQKYAEITPDLLLLREIYEKLAKRRVERGNMEIESDEAKLIIDKNGRCVGVEPRQRGVAEKLIEEFMLLANTAAAAYARELDIPFVYRVHEKSPEDKVEQLKTALNAADISFRFKKEAPTQKELAKLLDDARGTRLEHFVHNAVLRSMSKAKYEPKPEGHYGLALEDYAHFTSPIRRYPDLAIHRILTDVVGGLSRSDVRKKYKLFAAEASRQSSETELVAQQVERDCDGCYKAEYMQPFIGDEFEGTVSSVMQFGIYVQLPNTVEGLVHISRLSGEHLELVEGVLLHNPLTGKSYRIGDEIKVKLVGVDVSRGHIDFDMVE